MSVRKLCASVAERRSSCRSHDNLTAKVLQSRSANRNETLLTHPESRKWVWLARIHNYFSSLTAGRRCYNFFTFSPAIRKFRALFRGGCVMNIYNGGTVWL